MEKITYWLKKLGIMRSSSYSVKGDAHKLNEIEASDGGMIQSQKEIDDAHKAKQKESMKEVDEGSQQDQKNDGKKTSGIGIKITFWVFVVCAILFLLIFWSTGWTVWTFLGLVLWVLFLLHMKRRITTGTASMTFFIIAGIVLVVLSFIMTPTEQKTDDPDVIAQNDVAIKAVAETEEVLPNRGDAQAQEAGVCDASNSEHKSFNKVEKTIVSMNPCDVPWILAKESESYELKTKNGMTLHAIVWQNYKNNTEPAESFTIRVLDIDDSQKQDQKADIAIVRWVPNKSVLNAAKEEMQEIIEDLEY